jgi:hypothetical protein
LGHKITNAPLIWKVGVIIFFSWAKLIMGQFSGFSIMSFARKKKIISRTFQISGTLIDIFACQNYSIQGPQDPC